MKARALVVAAKALQFRLYFDQVGPAVEVLATNGSEDEFIARDGLDNKGVEVSVGQALVRLRAYAFGNDRHLTEVAKDLVARQLRLDAASGEKDPVP